MNAEQRKEDGGHPADELEGDPVEEDGPPGGVEGALEVREAAEVGDARDVMSHDDVHPGRGELDEGKICGGGRDARRVATGLKKRPMSWVKSWTRTADMRYWMSWKRNRTVLIVFAARA